MANLKSKKLELKIEDSIYPATGIAYYEGEEIRIKHALPGQKVKVGVGKKKQAGYHKGRLLEVVEHSPDEKEAECEHYQLCGGCNQQSLDYQKQFEKKQAELKKLFAEQGIKDYNLTQFEPSPDVFEYRNNMEFSFGDLKPGGKLQLGMHQRGRQYDVVSVDTCQLVDQDFRQILKTILEHFRNLDYKKYHIKRREGYLRHLVVRKGINTGEILVNLVTTSQREHDFTELANKLTELDYHGELLGFLQTINDDYSDAVQADELRVHYGRDYFYEQLLDYKFKVKPFSFFQTNTKGAEVLYQMVKDLLSGVKDKVVYDLYCGTGSVGLITARDAKKIYGLEVVKEAVEMARENAKLNGIDNCEFIAGDVLETIDELEEKPDVILIDPPRPGVHPKALKKIIATGAQEIIYVSCNPKTLARDLKELRANEYQIAEMKAIDMFPHTPHVESCLKLLKR